MNKLSELELNEESLELLENILEPSSKIFGDKEIAMALKEERLLDVCKLVLKGYKKEIIEICAYVDGEDPETYHVKMITLPAKIMALINDKDLWDFFNSQG